MSQDISTEQLELYWSLFSTRTDVYAKFWTSFANKKSGYAPVYHLKNKPSSLSEQVILSHLQGIETIGVYPLFPDNTCTFLVIDFDGKSWLTVAQKVLAQSNQAQIPAYLERSRSGEGGHVWIFFDQHLPAFKARQLGKLLLSRAGVTTRSTFDRMFPSQDEQTGKGFGNLICLPLHGKAMSDGNTAFILPSGEVCPDQWQFLAEIKKVTAKEIDTYLQKTQQTAYGSQNIPTQALRENSAPYKTKPDVEKVSLQPQTEVVKEALDLEPVVATTQGQEVRATLASSIIIPNLWLPDKLYRFLKKELNFPNPDFYTKERFGYSTWQTARFIKTLEVFPDHISVPLGFLTQLHAFVEKEQLTLDVTDECTTTKNMQFPSTLLLRPDQQKILKSLLQTDRAILEAQPGFGKTMVALALMKKRQQCALIIVHTKILLDQWLKRLKTYFKLTKADIGVIGNNKWQIGKKVTVASYMTLARRDLAEIKDNFGLVIIDECHHVPANTFSDVVKQFSAKYVLGLTATAYRKDKLEKLMHFYISRNIVSATEKRPDSLAPTNQSTESANKTKSTSIATLLETQLVTRKTAFTLAHTAADFQELGKKLIENETRNNQIASNISEVLLSGAKCLVLTERVDHCATLLKLVREKSKNIQAAIATGNMTKKNRERIAKRMTQERFQLLIATGKLIGEGFDWPAVSHLFLAFPFSWKGKLVQYVGRVQRPYEGKTTAVIHDYFDDNVQMLKLMYFKRLRTYRSLELTKITAPATKKKHIDENQQSLFSI